MSAASLNPSSPSSPYSSPLRLEPEKTSSQADQEAFLKDVSGLDKDQIQKLKNVKNLKRLSDKQIEFVTHDQIQKFFKGKVLVNKLSAKQIEDSLPDKRVRHVTNPEIVKALKDKALFVAPAMVVHLSRDRFKLLTSPLQIEKIPDEAINKEDLDRSQYCHLTPNQIWGIGSSKVIAQFDEDLKEKVKHIHPEMVPHLKPELIKYLETPAQLKKVKAEHYDKLTLEQWNIVLLEHLDDFDKITKEQLKCIPKNLLRSFLSLITKKQIKELNKDDIELIQKLTAGPLEHLDANLVPLLHNSQYQLLHQPKQLKNVPADKQQFLLNMQVCLMCDEGLKNLKEPRLIQAVHWEKLGVLTKDQLKELAPHQVKTIQNPKIIKLLPPNLLIFVEEELLKQSISDDQVKELMEPKVLAAILPEKEKLLTQQQVEKLPDTALRRLKSPDVIKRVSPKKACHLSPKQYSAMTPDQAKNIKGAGVQSLPTHLLSPGHVRELSASKVGKLDDPKLIQAVQPDRLHELAANQYKDLSSDQIGKIFSNSQFTTIFAKLSLDQHQHIDANKIPKNDPFMSECPQSIIQRITDPKVLAQLPQAAIHKLSPDQVKKLPIAQLKFLSDIQVPHVGYYYLSDLGRTRFFQFTAQQKAYYIAQLTFKCVVSLSMLCLVASLFHSPSRQWVGKSFKSMYELMLTLTKKRFKS